MDIQVKWIIKKKYGGDLVQIFSCWLDGGISECDPEHWF